MIYGGLMFRWSEVNYHLVFKAPTRERRSFVEYVRQVSSAEAPRHRMAIRAIVIDMSSAGIERDGAEPVARFPMRMRSRQIDLTDGCP